jgi:CDP-diacylglycerol--glycerol-3-phosphate 3-phosphatidyltransferase
MTPNQITLLRVLLAFLAVALYAAGGSGIWGGGWTSLSALALTIAAVALDALDGYIARRRQLATPLGAQLDILGDRVIEQLFFTYFAVSGLISVWVPVFFFVRGTLTDFVRGLATREGREGFGRNSMMDTWWGRALVASRGSRAAYGILKCICFCYLGVQLVLLSALAPTVFHFDLQPIRGGIVLLGEILVGLTVAFCLVRGLPVLWEGRRYLERFAPAGSNAGGRRSLRPAGVASR